MYDARDCWIADVCTVPKEYFVLNFKQLASRCAVCFGEAVDCALASQDDFETVSRLSCSGPVGWEFLRSKGATWRSRKPKRTGE
jgi:hypothetical protein